jgi:hypothetical protein
MDLLFPCFPYWSNILQLLTISIFFGVIILYIFKIDRKFTVVSLALLRNNRTKDQNLGSVMASMCSNGSCHLPFWSIWFIFLPGYAFFPQLRELPSVTMISLSLSLSLSPTHTHSCAHTHTHTLFVSYPLTTSFSPAFSLSLLSYLSILIEGIWRSKNNTPTILPPKVAPISLHVQMYWYACYTYTYKLSVFLWLAK